MIEAVKAELQGEVLEFFPDPSIRPCSDCRFCREHPGCTLQDGWQALEQQIRRADRILIASPVWFGTLPGELLSMLSRLQSGFNARFFRREPQEKGKKGGILLTAGSTGGAEGAIQTATILLKEMGVEELFPPVCSLQTDRIPARQDQNALAGAKQLADFLNQ